MSHYDKHHERLKVRDFFIGPVGDETIRIVDDMPMVGELVVALVPPLAEDGMTFTDALVAQGSAPFMPDDTMTTTDDLTVTTAPAESRVGYARVGFSEAG